MKLPGRIGYGIAVPEPGRATPYLLSTNGLQVNNIRDLKIFGFSAVIDLGTSASSAKLHRAETEEVGMKYFNLPYVGGVPSPSSLEQFTNWLLDPKNTPMLIYARKAEMIAGMWTSYRLKMGSPIGFALQEGRSLGLLKEQQAELKKRVKEK